MMNIQEHAFYLSAQGNPGMRLKQTAKISLTIRYMQVKLLSVIVKTMSSPTPDQIHEVQNPFFSIFHHVSIVVGWISHFE